MFVVDTNIWLELLLDQEKADEVREFLETVESTFPAISEFSLYSVGIILSRLNNHELYIDFLSDTVIESKTGRICLWQDTASNEIPVICGRFKWLHNLPVPGFSQM